MTAIEILDKLPSSDHLPLQAAMDVDFNCVFSCIDVSACPKDKISYNWSQCTPDDLEKYYCSTYDVFSDYICKTWYYLGCILDSKLNMSQHVSRVCKSANYYLLYKHGCM